MNVNSVSTTSSACCYFSLVEFAPVFKPREAFSIVETPDGSLSWYKTLTNVSKRLSRAKSFVIGCHVLAQQKQLMQWLPGPSGDNYPAHMVLTRILDDTNIWVQPGREQEDSVEKQDQDDVSSDSDANNRKPTHRGKQKMKVSPVLGFVQRICARRPGAAAPEFCQLHVPAQVLPKAFLVNIAS